MMIMKDFFFNLLLLPLVAVVLLIFTAKMTLEAIREARQ
jgi:hypothetical protein